MPDNTDPDNDEIDTTDQTPRPIQDAEGRSADGDHTPPDWMATEPGLMTVMEVKINGGGPIDINEVDAEPEIATRVGTADPQRLVLPGDVQVWVGVDTTEPVNHGATRFVRHLVESVDTGDYVADDSDRDTARALLATPEDLPVLHGTCLVTGVGAEGGPAPLSRSFQDWFTRLIDMVGQIQQAHAAEVIADAREKGLDLTWEGGTVYTFEY